MKKILLTLLVLLLPFSVSAENLIQSPEDFSNSAWTKYGGPTITPNDDGSQTLSQSVAATNYVQQLMYTNNNLTDGESYVFRVQVKPTSGELARVRINRYKDDGIYASVTPFTTPLDYVDWVPFTIPFQANMASDNPGYFQIEGPDTSSDINIKSLLIAANPGTTLYSTGDSICTFSINDTFSDSSTQYTAFYSFSENIVARKKGLAGAKLANIYSDMQANLASEHYPVIFIEGGFNDINAGPTPLNEMQSAMSAIITFARTKADHIVVFNIPPTLPQAQRELQYDYNAWLLNECATQGVQHFDMVAVLGTGGGGYGLDRNMDYYAVTGGGATHPNAAGHEALATALSEQVTLPASKLIIDGGNPAACFTNNQCDDGLACTTDLCVDAGTADAYCESTLPACSSEQDICCDRLPGSEIPNVPPFLIPAEDKVRDYIQYSVLGPWGGTKYAYIPVEYETEITGVYIVNEPQNIEISLAGKNWSGNGYIINIGLLNQNLNENMYIAIPMADAWNGWPILFYQAPGQTSWQRDVQSRIVGSSSDYILARVNRAGRFTAAYITPVVDNDKDGYSVAQGDCNDYNLDISPGTTEICENQVDDNCDGQVDENCITVETASSNELEWQQIGHPGQFNHSQAVTYCSSLVESGLGWRLPTKDELKKLVVCTNGTDTPLADETSCGTGYRFPTIGSQFSCFNSRYWTNTAEDENFWAVNFYTGQSDTFSPVSTGNVRCVRSSLTP
ncbi:MAG: DUF1566 domain-containing protein [Thermodesulfobacteriota bacterium]|nr:DUF1566 domain-containing protein [Thermodesulfobacteriota bacterium]